MNLNINQQEHYTIVKLSEEKLDTLISPELKSQFVFLHNEGVHNLILDMSSVKFVDSSGLSAILTANRLWSEKGEFILAAVEHENVQKLIQISRLETVLTIIPTTQEAIDYVIMSAIEEELRSGGEDS